MNRIQLTKLAGVHLRLLPVPIGPNATPLEEDWLIQDLKDNAVVFHAVGGDRTVVVGYDSVYSYTSEPGRDTATTKYGCIQLLGQIEIRRDG